MPKNNNNLPDEKEIRFLLEKGARELGISLGDNQLNKLSTYLVLLSKWNAIYNLTAIRDWRAMLTHHLMDSLSIVPFLLECKNLLDVGSGGGLPGLILAIAYPELKVTLIDIVHKKTAFMNQVKIELALKNVTVCTGRVEELFVDKKFDVIVSRAFSSLSDFVSLSGHLLDENGRFYAMKGLIPEEEISNLDPGWKVSKIEPLKVPCLEAQRHLIVMAKSQPVRRMQIIDNKTIL